MKGQKILKKYLVNPINSQINKLKLTSSYFIQAFDEIFKNEEYMDLDGNLIKCYSCDGEDILKDYMNLEELGNFLKTTPYTFEMQNDIIKDVELVWHNRNKPIPISYCKKCKRIMSLFDVPYIFKFSDTDELEFRRYTFYMADKLIKDNGKFYEIEICPRCQMSETAKENIYYDEQGITEFDMVCKKCGYKLFYFAYGAIEYQATAMKEFMTKNDVTEKQYYDFNLLS